MPRDFLELPMQNRELNLLVSVKLITYVNVMDILVLIN